MGVGAVPRAVARINYRMLRIPLRLVDDAAMRLFGEQARLRLAYERLLVDCDRAAAALLDDEALRRRSAGARVSIIRRQRRMQQDALAFTRQRARFGQRRPPGPSGTHPA